MIFAILYPFLVVSFYAIMEALKNKNNKMKTASSDWIDKGVMLNTGAVRTVSFMLDWGLPILVTIFISLYWSLGLANYTWANFDSSC